MEARANPSGYDEGELADEGTPADRFLRELYGRSVGRAAKIVSGKNSP